MTISTLMPTYARAELAFERGEGPWLFTADGARYLDFVSGIAVNTLGHAHPKMIAAVEAQARQVWHTSNAFQIPRQQELGDMLVAHTFADTVFFCNSGTEAIEGAIKIARRYHYANDRPGLFNIIGCHGAFHGRTLAALAAAGNAQYMEGFGPPVEGFLHVPFGDFAALKKAVGPTTAAIAFEPIQGEGGVNVPPPGFMKDVRKLCDDEGILLILDEVQCGMGRTGKLFEHEWEGITPDIMCIAKGLGGGFPVGAILATEAAASGMVAGTHGTTFGGNPLAMAVGKAVLEEVLSDGFLDNVQRIGGVFRQRLEALVAAHPDKLAAVRGMGLMLGLKCKVDNIAMVAACRDAGLLVPRAGDNVIRLLPPLNIDEDIVGEAMTRLEAALAAVPMPEAA